MAQAVHAAFKISEKFPETVGHWFHGSNYLVIVSVPDEASLIELGCRSVVRMNRQIALVREPDLDDQATALAFAPGDEARRLCANLPLALREVAMA